MIISPRFVARIALALSVCAAAVVAASPAHAGTILLAPDGGTAQVNYFEPIGQSFTAEDSYVSAGLYFRPMNALESNDDDIRYELREGGTAAGTLLASSSFALASDFIGFYLVDFSSVALTPGSLYNLTASILGDSPFWGVGGAAGTYAGGATVSGQFAPSADTALLVQPTNAAVPEPASMLLLGTGLLGAGVRRWRQRKA